MLKSDFLIIGSGIAGLTYGLDVCKYGKVTILCKDEPGEGNTTYAQGGIAAVTSCNDSIESHVNDTLTAGAGLCDKTVVQTVIEESGSAINFLLDLGVNFDLTKNSGKDKKQDFSQNFSLGKEGGHSERRILHAGDQTGREIQNALLKKVRAEKNITIVPMRMAIDLIINSNNECLGVYCLNLNTNEAETYGAKITYLATGGLGKVYLYTSNPDVATGDGIAIAKRAGALIKDMEFIQFHPTCLYSPVAKNFLITEAIRGEGAILKTVSGARFMDGYHPLKELAPRDIVARAIDHQLKISGEDYVLLDITDKSEEYLKERFPNIFKVLMNLGINISKDGIPVVPAAHYSCGGVAVDKYGLTSIKNLYAGGEVSRTGLHGANRLASNSLLEAVVYARISAAHSLEKIESIKAPDALPEWDHLDTDNSYEQVLVTHSWDEVRRTMWNLVGIVRNTKRLESAHRRLLFIKEEINQYYWKYRITKDLLELRNIIDTSLEIVEAALLRKESVGLHYLESDIKK